MKRLNICVDIDGTITEPYYWLEKANTFFNRNVKPIEVVEYDIHSVLDIDRDDYLTFYNIHGESLHRDSDHRAHASHVLNALAKQHNIYYVTAREERMKDVTLNWLKEHDMPTAPLYLLGSHHKVQQAKELDCDLFIEDKYSNALELGLSDIKVLLIDCSYNRFAPILNIERVFNWLEIRKKVQLLSKTDHICIKSA